MGADDDSLEEAYHIAVADRPRLLAEAEQLRRRLDRVTKERDRLAFQVWVSVAWFDPDGVLAVMTRGGPPKPALAAALAEHDRQADEAAT